MNDLVGICIASVVTNTVLTIACILLSREVFGFYRRIKEISELIGTLKEKVNGIEDIVIKTGKLVIEICKDIEATEYGES